MTKREMLNAIMNAVEEQEYKDFLQKEIDAIDARNQASAKRRANASTLKTEAVFEALAEINEKVTVTEIIENAPNEVAGFTRQKVSAALAKLVEQGRVKRELDKRTAYFYVEGD